MLTPVHTKRFEKDVKLAQKRGKNLQKLKNIMTCLVAQDPLPPNLRDHWLTGNYSNRKNAILSQTGC